MKPNTKYSQNDENGIVPIEDRIISLIIYAQLYNIVITST